MTRRKQRILTELYAITKQLEKPETTPVLEGIFPIQGPKDEAEEGLHDKLGIHLADGTICKDAATDTAAVSGSCNVCAAPCSSCMHLSFAASAAESKLEAESSNEVCAGKGCMQRQSATNEMSTSASSACNSFSADDGSISILQASEDVEVFSKLPADGGTSSKNLEDDTALDQEMLVSRKIDSNNVSCVTDAKAIDAKGCPTVVVAECSSSAPQPLRLQTGDSGIEEEFSAQNHPSSLAKEDSMGNASELSFFPNFKGDAKHLPHLEIEAGGYKKLLSELHQNSRDVTCPAEACSDKKPALQSQIEPDTETSGSDVVENDVKVCDICGDAGREDLLALCSRCSDGAEHTYCMRMMLDKVPEGDWLCEECKLKEDADNSKLKKIHIGDHSPEKLSSSENSKLQLHGIDCKEGCIGEADGLEIVVGALLSPKQNTSSCPSRSPRDSNGGFDNKKLPSRESSFKGLNYENTKPTLSNCATPDMSEVLTAVPKSPKKQLSADKGGFSLSSSSSCLYSKSKATDVLDELLHKKMLGKDIGGMRVRKEELNRSFSKSLPLKKATSGLSSATILKTKIQSSSVIDGSRVLNTERMGELEREKSLRPDFPVVNRIPATPEMQTLKTNSDANYVSAAFDQSSERKSMELSHREDMETKDGAFSQTAVTSISGSLLLCKHGADRNILLTESSDRNWKRNTSTSGTSSEANFPVVSLPSISRHARNLEKVVAAVPSVLEEAKSGTAKSSTNLSSSGCSMHITVIPEYECIWQGCLKVHKNGEFHELHSGIQAHLSNCASPKVCDVVRKFPRKMEVEVVPRLNIWPIEFCEKGATEENIALYLFAQDVESYEKNYKTWVGHIIRNDLALKGRFGGVELLIFSSSQLPEQAHRWNRLFYLWAVFRETRNTISGDCYSQSGIQHSGKCNIDRHNADGSENLILKSNQVAEEKAVIDISKIGNCCAGTNSSSSPQSGDGNCKKLHEDVDNDDGTTEQEDCSHDYNLDDQCLPHLTDDSKEHGRGVTHKTELSAQTSKKQNNSIADRGFSIWSNNRDSFSKLLEKQHLALDLSRPSQDVLDAQNLSMINKELGPKQQVGCSVGRSQRTDTTIDVCDRPIGSRKHYLDIIEGPAEVPSSTHNSFPEIDCAFENEEHGFKKVRTDHDKSSSHYCKDALSSERASAVSSFFEGEKVGYTIPSPEMSASGKPYCNIHPCPFTDEVSVQSSWQLSPLNVGQLDIELPSLELALGDEKHATKEKNLSCFLKPASSQKNEAEVHNHVHNEKAEDVAASLSLSLAFPFSGKELAKKPETISETAQCFPSSRNINTSLLLFGGSLDTTQ